MKRGSIGYYSYVTSRHPVAARSIARDGVDLVRTLKPLAFFPSDPTVRLGANRFERATYTPEGTASIRLDWNDRCVSAQAWGDGADWLLDRLEALIGLNDEVGDFNPGSSVVAKLWRRFPGLRISASHTLWHDTSWLVPGQRVASVDAATQWAAMTRRWGTSAPGPVELLLPVSPEVLRSLPYYDLHEVGLERKRATALQQAARYIPRFQDDSTLPVNEFRRKIELVPGLGQWMSTNLATMTAGHPDEVVLGDYGLPSFITWALAGERVGTDERMLELLEPYRPHRWRVCRLIMSSGIRPPRHGPRRRNPRIERM